MSENDTPKFLLDGFHCPNCKAWTQQEWYFMRHETYWQPNQKTGRISKFYIAKCLKPSCGKISIWTSENEVSGSMVYPGETTAPLPIEQMPNDVKEIFEEARQIFEKSPRAAAGLLRLSIQILVPHLGENEKNLNQAIGNLVKKDLPEIIQQALDSLRVIGNNAVHPGQIDVNDDRDTALSLFLILNTIIDRTIVQEKRISEIYEKLPSSAKEQIKQRDMNSNGVDSA